MPGICTSRMTQANLLRSISDRASLPELAMKNFAGRFFSTFSVTNRFSLRSSTIRMFGSGAEVDAMFNPQTYMMFGIKPADNLKLFYIFKNTLG